MLVLASTFPKSLSDGTPSFVLDLAIEHAKDFDIRVLTPMIPGAKRWETISGVRVSRFHYLAPAPEDLADGSILDNLKKSFYQKLQLPFLIASNSYRLVFMVLNFRPQVIHAHWIFPQGLLASLLAPFTPILLTAHGGDVYALNSKFFKALKRFSLKRAAAITTMNSEMAQRLETDFGAKSQVIPMGVRFQELEITKNPKKLVFVGRLVEKKGLQYLLEAVAEIDCELVVIGNGPLNNQLRAMAPNNTVFLGQQSKQRVLEELATAAIFVLPSIEAASGDREGLPVTLMEAAMVGTAVIASDLPGINEVVTNNHTGLLVNQKDSAALKSAIETLLADKQLRDLLASNLKQESKQFDVEVVAEKYKQLLMGLI